MGRRENLMDKLFTQLSAVVLLLGSAGLKKNRVTMVKTFDPMHCNGKAFTVQSKGIPVLGTLGLV
jgi:hypothetical protein